MQSGDDDVLDHHRNAPLASPECLFGLIGDIARAGSENTEANPFAIALNTIAYISCAAGRGPYMEVGNTKHHCRQFTLHIGRTGRGRKGDALALVSRVHEALRASDEFLAPQVFKGGLSTREGLIMLIHDEYMEGKTKVIGINDKRLCVVESEFENVLQQGKRDGNTLSAALRVGWDGESIQPATKNNRMSTTEPHICLSGGITPTELRSVMAKKDLKNGFANRFLMIWAERIKITPFPIATPQIEVNALAKRVKQVLEHCAAQRWVEKDCMLIELSPEARQRYEILYLGELNDNSAGDQITALIERRAPMLLRLAMLFALCDLQIAVEVQHINAAMAWIRYSVDSVKFVFSSAAAEADSAEISDIAKKIVAFLGLHPKATRKQLTMDCFKGHVPKRSIDPAIEELLLSNPPVITVESIPRLNGSPGSATKRYELTGAKSDKSANTEENSGKT